MPKSSSARAAFKVLHVAGARPNFVKIAPLMRALARDAAVDQVLVHTGQHYDDQMSAVFFRDLQIPEPDFNLGAGSGTHTQQTAAIMLAVEPIIEQQRPDLVSVVGDVNSTVACALVAAKMNVPVAHVEAGLRSRDRSMPEEINRLVTDQLSDLLFTPSRDADDNLRAEGILPGRIFFVGNIMIDTLRAQLEAARSLHEAARRGLEPGQFALVTLHRPSNVDDPEQLQEIYRALAELARSRPVLFPMHPRTRRNTDAFALWPQLGNVRVTEPVGYLQALSLLADAAIVLTDSGGIQEETTALGVPCVTLRDTTERPITLLDGTNVLVPERSMSRILEAIPRAQQRRGRTPDKWDGHTAERIAEVLRSWSAQMPPRTAHPTAPGERLSPAGAAHGKLQ